MQISQRNQTYQISRNFTDVNLPQKYIDVRADIQRLIHVNKELPCAQVQPHHRYLVIKHDAAQYLTDDILHNRYYGHEEDNTGNKIHARLTYRCYHTRMRKRNTLRIESGPPTHLQLKLIQQQIRYSLLRNAGCSESLFWPFASRWSFQFSQRPTDQSRPRNI